MKMINENTYELEETNYNDTNAVSRFNLAYKVVVHDGIFHADDVFFYAICREVFCIDEFVRTSDKEFLDNIKDDPEYVIGDIGHGRYDHHDPISYIRPTGEMYATFGLLWRDIGKAVCRTFFGPGNSDDVLEKAAAIVDARYIAPMDALDNQQRGFKSIDYYGLIKSMNPAWDSDESVDDRFIEAANLAIILLKEWIKSALAEARAEEYVKPKAEEAANGDHILRLDRYAPYSNYIKGKDIQWVLFPSSRGGIQSMCYSNSIPKELWGRPKEELPEGWLFAHKSGTMCSFATWEDAERIIPTLCPIL
jgi:uncharacterized UPF0160 family protein